VLNISLKMLICLLSLQSVA